MEPALRAPPLGLRACDLAIWDVGEPAELGYAIGANPCVGVVKDGVMRTP